MWQHHFEVNRVNAENLDLAADAVLIHDPQPIPLVEFRKGGKWIWRCHIDAANPAGQVWGPLSRYGNKYDAAIFSVAKFARAMPIDEFVIAPSIDPLSDKNRELSEDEIRETVQRLQIPPDRPIILQVSRFDSSRTRSALSRRTGLRRNITTVSSFSREARQRMTRKERRC